MPEGIVKKLNELGVFPGRILKLNDLNDLSQGANGIAYTVKGKEGKKEVVVKKLLGNGKESIAGEKIYRQYCETQGNNLHSSLAQTIYADDDIVLMEYCEGENLGDMVRSKSGHQKKSQAREAVEKNCGALLEGISCLGRAGICHGDIKPANLMCGKDGSITMVDFGSAHSSTKPGRRAVGTPSYRAPETLGTDEYCNDHRKADLWALGIVMLTILAGKESDIILIFTKECLGKDPSDGGIWGFMPFLDKVFKAEGTQKKLNDFISATINSIKPNLANRELWEQLLLRILKINPNERIDIDEACGLANTISPPSRPAVRQRMRQLPHPHPTQQVVNMFPANQLQGTYQQVNQQQSQFQQLQQQYPYPQQNNQFQQLQPQQNQPQQTNNVFQQTNQLQMGSSWVNQLPMGQVPHINQQQPYTEQGQYPYPQQNQFQQSQPPLCPEYTPNVIDLSEEIEEEKRRRKEGEEERKRKEERRREEERKRKVEEREKEEERRIEGTRRDVEIIKKSGFGKPEDRDSSGRYTGCRGNPQDIRCDKLLANSSGALSSLLGTTVGSGNVTFLSEVNCTCMVENSICRIEEIESSRVNARWKDGSSFSGNIENFNPTDGKLTTASGLYYEGPFGKDGRPLGQGIMRGLLNSGFAPGTTFEGPCLNGQPHGVGTITLLEKNGKEKCRYKCRFSNGLKTRSLFPELGRRMAYMWYCMRSLARSLGRLLCLNCLRAGKEIDDNSGLEQSSSGVKKKNF
ncbi:MAG: protein kinase [Rickettsiales bacterium]|nr:protein kinase [Rickettsiales bacterium]